MCLNHQLSCKTLWRFTSVCKCLEVVKQIPGIWAWLLVPGKLTCFHLWCPSGKPLAASLAEPVPHTARVNPISDKASISTQTPLVRCIRVDGKKNDVKWPMKTMYIYCYYIVIHHLKSEGTANPINAVRKANGVSDSCWKAPNLYDFMDRWLTTDWK